MPTVLSWEPLFQRYYELDVDFITEASHEARLLLRHGINHFDANGRLYYLLIIVRRILQELSIESLGAPITSDVRELLGVGHDVAIQGIHFFRLPGGHGFVVFQAAAPALGALSFLGGLGGAVVRPRRLAFWGSVWSLSATRVAA